MCPSLLQRLRLGWLIPAVLVGLGGTKPALAHKVVVFATVEGETVHGEAYFRGGDPVRAAKVTVVGPDENVLGETKTDDEGRFTFPVRLRTNHTLIVDAGEGHRGEYTVPAEELAGELPTPDGTQSTAGKPPGSVESSAPLEPGGEAAPRASREEPVATPGDGDLRARIEAVGREVAALRKDLDRYKNELRLQDVLGGLGYILGIMGLVFYFLGVRRKEKAQAKGNRGA